MQITVDNGVIDRLLATPQLAALLPCLSAPPRRRQRPGCSSCSGGNSNIDYAAIKMCLATADVKALQRLKHGLGATKLIIHRATTRKGQPGTVRHTR